MSKFQFFCEHWCTNQTNDHGKTSATIYYCMHEVVHSYILFVTYVIIFTRRKKSLCDQIFAVGPRNCARIWPLSATTKTTGKRQGRSVYFENIPRREHFEKIFTSQKWYSHRRELSYLAYSLNFNMPAPKWWITSGFRCGNFDVALNSSASAFSLYSQMETVLWVLVGTFKHLLLYRCEIMQFLVRVDYATAKRWQQCFFWKLSLTPSQGVASERSTGNLLSHSQR